eukprot:TRINITY_DN5555_c0_g1_i1.p1 TRINITY_DN5555_c0_g1~~TRINITY_DN5555_c0_g1_i1.p1  ORF type:complete len:309 (+),score=98.73 TRINITY_DN5555_c0_g1_i1:69-995(+)
MLACAAVAAAAAAAPVWRSQALNADGSVTLRWLYDAEQQQLSLNISARLPQGTSPGWLGIGFSPDGLMRSGDYIVGYMAGPRACVRSLANGDKAGLPPTLPPTFNVSRAAIAFEGDVMSISGIRPFTGANVIKTSGTQKVLFAAGSAKVVPATCDAVLAGTNHHDLGAQGLVGAADVDFSGLTVAPTPAPAPHVAAPTPGAYCSVCSDGLCFPANMTIKDASHFSYYDPQLTCVAETYTYSTATGALDISADLADPTDCFAEAANRTHSTFSIKWNGTHVAVANSLFPAVFLVRSGAAGAVCPPPSLR